MVSHRSGETEGEFFELFLSTSLSRVGFWPSFRSFSSLLALADVTIADLAVALGVGIIKTGAPCRSERESKSFTSHWSIQRSLNRTWLLSPHPFLLLSFPGVAKYNALLRIESLEPKATYAGINGFVSPLIPWKQLQYSQIWPSCRYFFSLSFFVPFFRLKVMPLQKLSESKQLCDSV